MRKWITFLMTLLVGSSLSYANAESSQVTFEAGYRRDNISWTHKVPSCDPVFKTSTKFEDIDIFQIGLSARTMVGCNFYLRADASWGWILDGDFKESVSFFASPGFSDFGSEDFSQDFAFTASNRDVIDDKYVYDLDIAIGYPFYFCDCTLAISPIIGYSVHEQAICVENEGFDFESFDGFLFPTSGSECCCHKFHNRWYGPFIGVDFNYRPCGECWSLYAELEYHYAQYKAKFHDDIGFFDDHNHRSRHAHGWVFKIGADYDFACDWTIGLSVKVQDWRAHRNHRHDCDESEFSSFFGSSDFGRARNTHKWHSCAVNLALGKSF